MRSFQSHRKKNQMLSSTTRIIPLLTVLLCLSACALAQDSSKTNRDIEKNSDVARAQFEMAVWQLTNDLKRKFYTVILNQSLLNLAQENEKTFAEIVKHTEELVKGGELAGLDLTRLEVEKLKFDTDLANS